MNKKILLSTISVIILAWQSCSDDISPAEEELSYANFLQDTITVSSSGGEAIAFVEWAASNWEIEMDEDKGVVTNISPKTGAHTVSKQSARIKFTCSINTTGKERTQEIFLLNKTSGERSKLLIKQSSEVIVSIGIYVSTTGSDKDGDGSKHKPFRTIAKAATTVQPGDTVFVEEGTYSEHSIRPAISGIEGAMIVFKPASSISEVIIKHPAVVFEDKTSVFDLTDRNYIQIEGFNFRDYKYDKASVFIKNGVGNVVINNRFENLGNNQVMDGTATCVVYIYNSKFNTIRNNYFKNIYGDGVHTKRASYNNLVSENTFIDFKGKPRGWAPTGSFSSNMGAEESLDDGGDNIFAFNYSEKGKAVIWFDRDGSRNVILRNVGKESQSLFFNESRCVKNLAQENIAINMTSPAYETARYETGWTEDARWINNVAYNCKTGYYVSKSWRDEFRNNITVNSGDYNLVFTDLASASGPHIFENNLWFTNGKSNSIQYEGTNLSVQDFASKVGETGTLSVDPQFVDPENGDFRLKESSPAKGAADTGIDLGAYAVYPKTEVGYDDTLPLTGNMQVSFNSTISTAVRGNVRYLILDLNRTADKPISVEVVPVAGDARDGVDYDMESRVVTFNMGDKRKNVAVTFKGTAKHDQLVAFRLNNPEGAQIGAKNLHVIRVNNN